MADFVFDTDDEDLELQVGAPPTATVPGAALSDPPAAPPDFTFDVGDADDGPSVKQDRFILEDGLKTPAKKHRENRSVSDATGVPVDVVERDDGGLEASAKRKEIEDKVEGFPKSKAIVFDFDIGKATVDDVDTMVEIEQEITNYDTFLEAATKTFQNLPEDFQKIFGGILQALGETPFSPGGTAGMSIEPEAFDEITDVIRASANSPEGLATVGRRLASEAEILLAENAPNLKHGTLPFYANEILRGTLNMIPSLAVSFLTRNPTLGSTIMGLQVFGQRYDDARRAGRDPNSSFAEASFFAVAEILSEKIPLGILTRQGGPVVARLFKSMGAEALQEVFVEALDIGFDAGILNKDMTIVQAAQRLIDAGIIGAGVGGTLALPSHGASKLVQMNDEKRAEKRAEAYKKKLTSILNAAGQSPVAAENPQLFQEVLNRLKEGSGLETVRVNAAGLEATMEAAGNEGGAVKFLVEAGVDEAEVNRAAQLGQDVVVELPNFLRLVEEQKIRDTVLANVRETDAAPTLAEAEVQTADFKERVDAEAAAVLADLNDEGDSAKLQEDARVIGQDFEAQAIEAGAFPKNARNVASMVESFFITEVVARRKEGQEDLDINELYQKFGLKISQERAAGQVSLSQRVETVFQDIDNLIDLAAKRAERATAAAAPTPELQSVRDANAALDAAKANESKVHQEIQDQIDVVRERGGTDKEINDLLDAQDIASQARRDADKAVGEAYNAEVAARAAAEPTAGRVAEDVDLQTQLREERAVLQRILDDVTDILKTGTESDPFVRRALEELDRIRKLVKTTLGLNPEFDVSLFAPQLEVLRGVLTSGQPFPANDLDQAAQEYGVAPEQLAQELEAAGGDITKTPAFLAWFQDSKVVDENGEPLVVYHGTSRDFDAFDPERIGDTTASTTGGFFFGEPHVADSIADHAVETEEDESVDPAQVVLPVYLSLQDPFIVDFDGEMVSSDGLTLQTSVDTAHREGYDGVIAQNILDPGVAGEPTVQYIAFEPTQIKSQFNIGTFSLTDPNILRQSFKEEGIRNLTDAADDALSGSAAEAITGFIALAPRARDKEALSSQFGIMDPVALEGAYADEPQGEHAEIRQSIDAAFAPVREALRARFGDTVRLYRVQLPVDPGADVVGFTGGARNVLSWTTDEHFARHIAGVRPEHPVASEDDIVRMEKDLEEDGFVLVNTNILLRKANQDVQNQETGEVVNVEFIEIVNRGEVVTDTESVRAFVQDENAWKIESNEASNAALENIVVADIPLDDVVWASDRANQSEFIVRNRPGGTVFINEDAEVIGGSTAQDFALRVPSDLQQRPTIRPVGTHADLTTPELVAGFVVQPTSDPSATDGVSRAEVMERLRNDPIAQQRTQAALDAITPDDTVPMYRFIISGRAGAEVDFEEGDVSLSLTPEALFRNVNFLGFGKLAPGETLELIRYDVPKASVAGYLPALIPDIKRGVNKAIKDKGIGQQSIQGTLKVTDPAARAKELITMQEEVLADVTGLSSQRLGDIAGGGLSIETPEGPRTSFHEAVLSGLVQTAEDFLRLQPSNQRAVDTFEGLDLNSETFAEDLRAAEIAVVEPAINALTGFFGGSVRQATVDAAQPAVAAALKGQPKFSKPAPTQPTRGRVNLRIQQLALENDVRTGLVDPNDPRFEPGEIQAIRDRLGVTDEDLLQVGVPLFENPLPVTGTGGKNKNKVTIKDIGRALAADHKKKHKRKLFPEKKEEDFALVMEMAIADLEAQQERSSTGEGWYGEDVENALRLSAVAFPTLATIPEHRALYLTLAGLFSNGNDPNKAWQKAAEAFDLFLQNKEIPIKRVGLDGQPLDTNKDTGKPIGWSQRNVDNEKALGFLKFLVEREGGLLEANEWIFNEHSPEDINKAMLDSGLWKEGRFTTKAQIAGPVEHGAIAFGPKLGRYMMGLQGLEIEEQDTTIDFWYTRTYRRWTGRIMDGPLGPEGVTGQPGTPKERETIARITGELARKYDLEIGDVQAMLWFYEKRLWHAHGAKLDEGTNTKGAETLLERRGLAAPADRRGDGAAAAGRGAVGPQAELLQDGRTDLSPLGFFSQVRRNAQNFKQDTATGKEWQTHFDNTGPQAELETIVGLREMLAEVDGQIPKHKILQFIDQNGLHLDEVVLEDTPPPIGQWFVFLEDEAIEEDGATLVDRMVEQEGERLADLVSARLGIDFLNVSETQLREEAEVLVNIELSERDPTEITRRVTYLDSENNRRIEIIGSDAVGWRVVKESDPQLADFPDELFDNPPEARIAVEGWFEGGGSFGFTVFSSGNLVLPGGEGQREFYLTLPETPGGSLAKRNIKKRQKSIFERNEEVALGKRTQQSADHFNGIEQGLIEEDQKLIDAAKSGNNAIDDWLNPPGHRIGDPVADNRMVVRIRTNTRIVEEPGFVVENRKSGNRGPVFATLAEAEENQQRFPSLDTKIVAAPFQKRILFIEEIQGDRQQEADERGYTDPVLSKDIDVIELAKLHRMGIAKKIGELQGRMDLAAIQGRPSDEKLHGVTMEGWLGTQARFDELWDIVYDRYDVSKDVELASFLKGVAGGVPPIPWPTDSKWATLGLKRIIFKAVEEGYDSVAWTPAEVQIERYSLSRIVDELAVIRQEDGTFLLEAFLVGGGTQNMGVFTSEQLEGVVGEERAEVFRNQENDSEVYDGNDLDIGGKGMVRFYDEVLHDIANKIGKPFGKQKVSEVDIGIGQIRDIDDPNSEGAQRVNELDLEIRSLDEQTEEDVALRRIALSALRGEAFEAASISLAEKKQTVTQLEINDQMKELIPKQGLSVMQEKPTGPLGAFSSADPGALQIKLFEGADFSTLLHETGHMFVFMLEQMSQLPGASQRLKDNYQAMLEWTGARNADDLNLSINGEAARKKQEKLAEAFEAYLMEGKAPSAKLRSAFAQFAAWLKIIYTKFRQLGTQIDPEISRIFDTMLATDAEIEVMKAANEFDHVKAPASIKLLPLDQQAQWFNNQVEADELARNEAARVKREVELRAEQEVWLDELAKIEAEVEEELWKRAPYRALWYLTRGGFRNENTPAGMANRRLSKKDLLEAGMTQEELSALPKAGKVIYTNDKEDATTPDVLAPFLGFETGAELVEVLGSMIPAEQAIKDEARLIMESRHPSPLKDGKLQEITEQALYNEERRQVIKLEMDGLALAAGAASVTREEIKAAVDEIIANQPVSELMRPAKFMTAAVRAARASAKAEAAGDMQKAFSEKRKQMLNHELLRRSLKAKKDIEKGTKYLRKFDRPKKVSAIQADYVDRILELTSAYQLSPALSAARRDRLDAAAFKKWIIAAQKNDGAVLIIPEEILAADEKTHYKDMPLTDFEALVDTVKSLERQGRLAQRNIRADEEMTRKAIIKEIEVRMSRLKQTGPAARAAAADPGFFDPLFSAFRTFDAAMLKTEFLLEFMDGGPTGPAQSSIFQPFVDAERAENDLTQDFGEKFAEALDKLPKAVKKAMNKKVWVPALGRKATRSEILHIALNAGNISNLTKMIEGSKKDVHEGAVPLTEEGVSTVLQSLTAEEIDFVNTIWSLFEGMKEGVGEVHRRETSREPVWMDPLETKLTNGTLTGGYIPMMYDPSKSTEAADIENKSALESMQSEVVQASVFSGMTKERSEGFSAPVILDISHIPRELQKTAHFITHYEAVRNANKLVGNRDFKKMVVNKFGNEYYEILKSWVGQVAVGSRGRLRFDVVGDLVEHLRSNATVAIMGASVTTALTQPLGMFTAVDTLARGVDGKVKPGRGAFRMVQGILTMLNPGAVRAAYAASKELKFRRENSDRDIQLAFKQLKGRKGKKARIQRALLIAIPTFQFYTVDVPTFIGAFNMASASGMGDAKAAEFADSVMRKTQGAGSAKDLSAVLATRGTSRAVTMFMTFFNTLYNIQRRLGREAEWSLDFTYKLVAGSLVVYVLPSILEGLMRLEGPDPDDDEDSYLKWLAWKSAIFAGSTIPVVRDFVSGIGTAYGYDPTPLSGAGESVVKAWQDVQKILDDEKDLSLAVLRTLITMLGYTTGRVPSNQINRAVRAWEKIQEEGAEDFNYWQFFVGPDKREK